MNRVYFYVTNDIARQVAEVSGLLDDWSSAEVFVEPVLVDSFSVGKVISRVQCHHLTPMLLYQFLHLEYASMVSERCGTFMNTYLNISLGDVKT